MEKVFFVPDTRSNRRKAARSLQAKRPHQPIVILLSMPVAIHSIIGVLDMPEGNADRGVRAKEITDACEVSTYVTVPPATIEAVRTNITAYKRHPGYPAQPVAGDEQRHESPAFYVSASGR